MLATGPQLHDGEGAAEATPPPHARHGVTVSATRTPLPIADASLTVTDRKKTPAAAEQQGRQPTGKACRQPSSRPWAVQNRNRNAMIRSATTPPAPMTYEEAYADAWDETDDPPAMVEPATYGDDLEGPSWLDRHPSLTAAERNPSLR